ncbi:MAG: histidine triad nucleotide-binding protein [Planctomycetota bacterium]
MADTVFGKILRREIPADIVYEDEQCMAFRDINPQAPVHILLIPKKGISKLSDAQKEDTPLLGHLLWVVSKIVQQEKIQEGFRVVINNGKNAGQEVFHLHLHILAGRRLNWPPG